MLTSDDLLTTLKRLGEGIQRLETGQQRLETRQQRLEIYTKGIMRRLLSTSEIEEVEREAGRIEQPSRLSTADR